MCFPRIPATVRRKWRRCISEVGSTVAWERALPVTNNKGVRAEQYWPTANEPGR